MNKISKTLFPALVLFFGLSMTAFSQNQTKSSEKMVYLFSYFKDNGQDGAKTVINGNH